MKIICKYHGFACIMAQGMPDKCCSRTNAVAGQMLWPDKCCGRTNAVAGQMLWPDRYRDIILSEFHAMNIENACVEIADRSGVSFRSGDFVAPAVSALRDARVTEQIMSLGVNSFSQACGVLSENEISEIIKDPKLMAILFDYGLEVAPRTEQENVINIDELVAYGRTVDDKLGSFRIPEESIYPIRMAAQKRIVIQEQLAERNTSGHHAPVGVDVPGDGDS